MSVGAVDFTVDEVEMMLEYTNLASDAARMFSKTLSGRYKISLDSFVNLASSIETGANNCNIIIPARYSSLKTLFTIMRLQENIGTGGHTKKTITNRTNPFGDGWQWYFIIGGRNIPSAPVKANTEAAAELCKALHAFGPQSHTSLITRATWIADEGTYLISADLESHPHKSKLSESGVNTLSTNTYLIDQFKDVLAKALNVQTYAHYDGILII